MAGVLFAGAARAHPEHAETGYVVEVHLVEGARGIEALVRVPLGLLSGVGLPLRGARDVDVAAFRGPDPVAEDGASYAERAAGAVARAFEIGAGGAAVALTPVSLRLSGGDPDAFAEAGAARTHIAAGPADPAARIALHEGYLDVALTGPQASRPLTFAPTLGGAGGLVTFRVHGPDKLAGGAPIEVPGSGGSVIVAP